MPTTVSFFCNSVIVLLDVIAGLSCVGVAVDSALHALSEIAKIHARKILSCFILNLINIINSDDMIPQTRASSA